MATEIPGVTVTIRAEAETKRHAYLPVTADLMVEVLKDRRGVPRYVRVESNAIPEDARVVRLGADAFGVMNVVLESATFAEVPMHGAAPMLPSPVCRVEYATNDLVREACEAATRLRSTVQSSVCAGLDARDVAELLERLGHAVAQAVLERDSERGD